MNNRLIADEENGLNVLISWWMLLGCACWFKDQHDHSQAHSYIFLHRSAWRGRDKDAQKPNLFELNEIGQCIYRFVPFCPPEGWRFAERRNRLKSWQKSACLCQHLGRHDCWPRLLTVHLDESPHYTEPLDTPFKHMNMFLNGSDLSSDVIFTSSSMMRHICSTSKSMLWY